MATSYTLRLLCNLTFFTFLASIMIGSSVVAATTPGADPTTLAYLGFGLVHLDASSTQDQITSLLSNSTGPVCQHLERCRLDFATAFAKTEEALTDLDWEEFGRLISFAATTGDQAKDYESAFNGTKSPLADNNNDLYGLSGICVSLAQELSV